MKKLIQFLSLSALAFTLTACDPFEGLLSVKKTFNVISTVKNSNCGNGDAGSGQPCEQKVNVQLAAGDQNAKLEFMGRDQVRISVNVNGRKTYINMDIPRNTNIPQNGNFTISARDLAQSFSVQGGVATNTSDSQSFRGYEQCQYTRYDVVCNIVNNQQVCQQVPHTVYGQQYVEYFDRLTNQKINVNFVDTALLATFNGTRNSSQRIYTQKGQCF